MHLRVSKIYRVGTKIDPEGLRHLTGETELVLRSLTSTSNIPSYGIYTTSETFGTILIR